MSEITAETAGTVPRQTFTSARQEVEKAVDALRENTEMLTERLSDVLAGDGILVSPDMLGEPEKEAVIKLASSRSPVLAWTDDLLGQLRFLDGRLRAICHRLEL
jgi:hypothetical protein